MTIKNNKIGKHIKTFLLSAALMTLIISASGMGIPYAAAITEKTLDPGLGSGNNWWGVKASTLSESNQYWFGKLSNGSVNPAHPSGYKGRTNVLFIHEFRPGDNTKQFAIEWQAAIQGKDPWNNNGGNPNGIAPLISNSNFPAPATAPSAYNLKAQWIWTNDKLPLTDQINANYLTDLWFCKVDASNNCTNASDFIVIDFMFEQLKSSGNNGVWQQNIVSDADILFTPGTQYYTPYCNIETKSGINHHVYHYDVVVDNTSHGSGTWNEKIANVDQYITDAFNHSYASGGSGGCTHTIPDGATGHRSSFKIVDQETGIELSAQNFGKSGRVEGGISNSDLYY